MKLVRFITTGGATVYVNPNLVSFVQLHTEGDGTVVTQIKTINASLTVKEPIDAVVARLLAEEIPPVSSSE